MYSVVFPRIFRFRQLQSEEGVDVSHLPLENRGLAPISFMHHISKIIEGKTESYRVRVCRTCTKLRLPLELGSYSDVESALIVNDAHELLQGRTKQLHLLVQGDINYLKYLFVRKRGGVQDVPVLVALEERVKKSYMKLSNAEYNEIANSNNPDSTPLNTTREDGSNTEVLDINIPDIESNMLALNTSRTENSSSSTQNQSQSSNTDDSIQKTLTVNTNVAEVIPKVKTPLDFLSEIAEQQEQAFLDTNNKIGNNQSYSHKSYSVSSNENEPTYTSFTSNESSQSSSSSSSSIPQYIAHQYTVQPMTTTTAANSDNITSSTTYNHTKSKTNEYQSSLGDLVKISIKPSTPNTHGNTGVSNDYRRKYASYSHQTKSFINGELYKSLLYNNQPKDTFDHTTTNATTVANNSNNDLTTIVKTSHKQNNTSTNSGSSNKESNTILNMMHSMSSQCKQDTFHNTIAYSQTNNHTQSIPSSQQTPRHSTNDIIQQQQQHEQLLDNSCQPSPLKKRHVNTAHLHHNTNSSTTTNNNILSETTMINNVNQNSGKVNTISTSAINSNNHNNMHALVPLNSYYHPHLTSYMPIQSIDIHDSRYTMNSSHSRPSTESQSSENSSITEDKDDSENEQMTNNVPQYLLTEVPNKQNTLTTATTAPTATKTAITTQKKNIESVTSYLDTNLSNMNLIHLSNMNTMNNTTTNYLNTLSYYSNDIYLAAAAAANGYLTHHHHHPTTTTTTNLSSLYPPPISISLPLEMSIAWNISQCLELLRHTQPLVYQEIILNREKFNEWFLLPQTQALIQSSSSSSSTTTCMSSPPPALPYMSTNTNNTNNTTNMRE